jgi:hypothetical protein
MFNSAPFSRFDLGRHILGQAQCPAGTIPLLQNNKVVCVEGFAPGSMMTTGDPNPQMQVPSVLPTTTMMGQADPYLTQPERDKLLADIRNAVSQTKAIDDLLIWSGQNDPGLKKYLGMDSTRFSALLNSISPLYPTVSEIATRLAESDAEYWYRPSDQELAQVKQWIVGVSEMTKLIDKRRGQPYTAAPGTMPPPASVTQPAVAAPSATGVSTQDLLIGGAVAVGLGLLLSAVL